MNNDQAADRLMKLYQAEGEKIRTGTDDSELMSALDCAFGAFQVLEEAIVECKEKLKQCKEDMRSAWDHDEEVAIEETDADYRNILEILERYKDER